MSISLNNLRVRGETQIDLDLIVGAGLDADGKSELQNLIDNIESFYKTISNDANIPKIPRKGDGGKAFLYSVYFGPDYESNNYKGTVKITPTGVEAIVNRRDDADYPIADPTIYAEKFRINFFPFDRNQRQIQRDGYAKFIDPDGTKTKRM